LAVVFHLILLFYFSCVSRILLIFYPLITFISR
ncbi:hypothetical protein CVS40_0809, partial [Lucilia cuprina]